MAVASERDSRYLSPTSGTESILMPDPRPIAKILIVHGDESARSEIRGFMEHRGMHVESADNSADAIRLELVYEPKVVISSWHLVGETSGIDVARSLLKHVEGVRIVLLAGADMAELKNRCRDLAVSRFLDAGITLAKLQEHIDELLAGPPPDE